MSLCLRLCVLIFLGCAGTVQAQLYSDKEIEQTSVQFDKLAFSVEISGIDLTGWETLASRAESVAETGAASRFALGRIRAELVSWRDQFANALDINSNRLITVQSQINALEDPSDPTYVNPFILGRLTKLTALQDRLLQPKLLSQEAFARSNGLITEVDRQQRLIETQRLSSRGVSPVNPTYWPTALSKVKAGLTSLSTEILSISGAHYSTGGLWERLLLVAIALVGTGFSIIRAKSWIAAFKIKPLSTPTRSESALRFIISLTDIVIPILGLALVTLILSLSGIFGINSSSVIKTLPFAGIFIFFAKWLVDYYFPVSDDDDGILGYEIDVRLKSRRLTNGLGWMMAISVMVDALMATTEAEAVSLDVINFPFQLIVGVLLWKLGGLIVHRARPETAAIFKRSRLRVFIGRIAQVFAIAGPLASILGYGAAANAITIPTVVSLAIIAIVAILQRLSYSIATPDGSNLFDEDNNADPKGLLPVTINFILAILSLPALALIWGMGAAELIEFWTRFLAGFKIGETQISPIIFLTFILVFMLGVLITRFIKTTLKTTVMPRTKFDLGSQNAVIAGFGYVGMFLSALVAFGVAGIDLSSLAIVAGALSVGIGFGLQNIVSNFVSGIILLIERPVSEGDMIEVGGKMGYVRDISVRSTRIETFDRTDVIIPNADLISNQVTNWTRGNLIGRAIVPVGVAYGTDTTQVTDILREVAESYPLVLLNPPPSVLLVGLGTDSIDFEIRAIIRDVNFVLVAKSEMLHAIIARFEAVGIEIPFAQRDLWLRNPEVLYPKGRV